MCGITGFFDPSSTLAAPDYAHIITAMMDTIVHRGPDDSGFWKDDAKGIV